MKNLTCYLLQRVLLFLFCCCSLNGMALDDVIQIKSIVAGDTYPDASISPQYLISMEGLVPEFPTDLENTTYAMKDWNCWHTTGNDNSKAWLLLDLGKQIPVSKMYLWNLNQRGLKDRDIKDISVTYSLDSTNGEDGTWLSVGDYIVPQTAGDGVACQAQIVVDVNQTVRYLKIQALSAYGSVYWGLGKIVLLQDHSKNENEELLALKLEHGKVQGYKFYEYTDASWKVFATAMTKAEELLAEESKNTEEVKNATKALTEAVAQLESKENLIIGATAVANSFYGEGYEATNAVDGKFNTRWATQNGTEFWIEIDLGSPKTFNQIMVFETKQYSGRVENLKISVSDDGKAWTSWKEKAWSFYYLSAVSELVSKRYIKIVFDGCSNEGINVDEIMIFNDASAIETVDPTKHREEEASWIKQQQGTSPDVYQIRKAGLKYGMFIHYGINTFLGQEWTDGTHPASAYNPDLSTLDPESWIKEAYNGGMDFIVLVAKHHEGFALWNTEVGTYNINNTGRDGDKRDIVKEVADACKKYGIKFGLYYSAWDRNWDLHNTQESTGLDRVALNQSYNDFALAQMTELLDGRYGEVSELWIDGAWVKKNKEWEFARLYNTVKTLQPSCQFGVNITLNELPDKAQGGEEMVFFPSDFRLRDPFFTRPGANSDPKMYKYEGGDYYLPFEATICINNSWFWTANQNASGVLSAADIQKSYNHMAEQDNTLVLNLAPNANGVLNDFDVDGLYAAARLMGIARGEARGNIQSEECKVEVRHLTDKGHIVYPTTEIYGKEGESYSALPIDLGKEGYSLNITPVNATGKFTREKIVVEYIYKDLGFSSGIGENANDNYNKKVLVKGKEIVMECACDSSVFIYNALGLKVGTLFLAEGETKSFCFNNTQGLHIVSFIGTNGSVENFKVWIA